MYLSVYNCKAAWAVSRPPVAAGTWVQELEKEWPSRLLPPSPTASFVSFSVLALFPEDSFPGLLSLCMCSEVLPPKSIQRTGWTTLHHLAQLHSVLLPRAQGRGSPVSWGWSGGGPAVRMEALSEDPRWLRASSRRCKGGGGHGNNWQL